MPVFIKVLDVNDNAPEFAMSYDTFVCENVEAGQVLHVICNMPVGLYKKQTLKRFSICFGVFLTVNSDNKCG